MANKGFLPGYKDSIECRNGRERYLQKLNYINDIDPYEIPKNLWLDDVELWPSVSYIHVGMYLLFSQSPYSQEQLLNYKSLDCYQKFANGWVRDVSVRQFDDKCLLISKVNHSQRLSDKPLTPWVVCEKSGKIIAAHCDCMAGLGESCSHVGSLLWAIEAGVKKRNSLTVTDKKAYWVMPSPVKTVPYARVKDIQFKKQQTQASPKSASPSQPKTILPPTQMELSAFFTKLSNSSTKPAILSLIHGFSDPFIPKSLDPELPPPLGVIFRPELINATYADILVISTEELAKLKITPSQRKVVEEKTRCQANSKIWFKMRTGRVTASRFKSACHTDPACPSHTLVMTICHPELTRFNTQATRWGCNHEEEARNAYEIMQKDCHSEFRVTDSGLHIHPEHGFLGASPDGMVECGCCGSGICEIKCPFCKRSEDLNECELTKEFCLETAADGKTRLKKTHSYYYQVQAQIFCSETSYCDFVVWTEKSIHIERIDPDPAFWALNVRKAEEFTRKGVLPELLAKWYSRPPEPKLVSLDSEKFCYCREGESGEMIACDYNKCPYKWFHYACLQMKSAPRSRKWYCPDCQKHNQNKKRKTK